MRVVSEADATKNLSSLLRDTSDEPVMIVDGNEPLRVLIPVQDAFLRELKSRSGRHSFPWLFEGTSMELAFRRHAA